MTPERRAATEGEEPPKAGKPPKAAKPPKPWGRAEAGTYRSADERFTITSEGPSRWFVTDEAERDELGLARTTGPYPTLDAAKEAADGRRDDAPAASPLAERLARSPTEPARPPGNADGQGSPATRRRADDAGRPKEASATRSERSTPPKKTWLDRLEDEDAEAARRARRLIGALEAEGIPDAEDLVRRDVVGDQPAVATRLLARAIVAGVERATQPDSIAALAKRLPARQRTGAEPRLAATAAIEAAIEALGATKVRRGLPGWQLVERDGPADTARTIYLTPEELREGSRD